MCGNLSLLIKFLNETISFHIHVNRFQFVIFWKPNYTRFARSVGTLTLMACCIKSIAISRPNNSPARRVNLLIMEHAPRMASKKSKRAVHTHTLNAKRSRKNEKYLVTPVDFDIYHT